MSYQLADSTNRKRTPLVLDAPAAERVELILSDHGLKRRELGHLMALRGGIAAGEGAPTACAMGGLADLQLVDFRHG
jgi:hypothetical protein